MPQPPSPLRYSRSSRGKMQQYEQCAGSAHKFFQMSVLKHLKCCLQVHLSPAGVNSVTVSWATQNYTVGKGVVAPLPTAGVVTLVQYGASPMALTSTASGITEVHHSSGLQLLLHIVGSCAPGVAALGNSQS